MANGDDIDIKVIRVIQQGIPSSGIVTSYVDVVLDPVQLTTAPFYDPNSTGPGFDTGIVAPGANKIAFPIYVDAFPSGGDAWGSKAFATLFWGSPANFGEGPFNASSIDDQLNDTGFVTFGQFSALRKVLEAANNGSLPIILNDPTLVINQPIVIASSSDITNGGATVGTRSIRYRIYYQILDVTTFPSFFHITAINQGAKKITVHGDAHTLTGSISVVGSTGNNGTYTIVSATFVTDHTDIIVVQSIPSATADGWVKQ